MGRPTRRRPVMLGLLLAGCTAPAPLGPTPVIELVGCQEWPRGESCGVWEGEPLTIWAERPVEATLDGAPVEPREVTPVQGGLRFKLTPRPGLLALTAPGRQPYTLRLTAHRADPELAEVARLRRSGKQAEAEALLTRLTATGTRAGARGEAGRNALAAGRIEAARSLLEASIEEDEAQGRLRALLRDRTALAYVFMNHGYPPALARAQLDALAPLATRFSEAAADLDYFELVYSVRLRAPRTGLAASRRLLERAERLQLEESAVDARQLRAGLFALVGRWRELAAELEALRQDDERRLPCARARVLANLGWYGLLGHRQDPAQFPDSPRGPLLEAAAYYRSACPLAARVANVELNLGWEALFRGDLGEAHRRLDAATTSWPQPDFRTSLEQHHLAAELHLAEGELAAAVEAFSGVSIRAKAAGLPTIGWRASMALGEAWAGRGDRARAIEAYTAAADQLDALAEQVPFGEGRDTLLFDRAEGAERLVGTLSAAGDGLGAIEAIRRARRGALRWAQVETDLLHQRLDPERQADRARLQAARAALAESIAASWALPADALAEERRAASARSEEALSALNALLRPAPAGLPPLAPPEPDTGALFVHPLGSGMVAWLWTPAGRFTATASSATPGALAALSPHLGGLRRLTVYATPGLEALDWSAWPVGGRPLYTQTTVVYPADAPGRRVGPPDPGRRAIVLADPAGGLPGAQTEGREVARVLAGQGFQVEAQVGAATHEQVVGLLSPGADLLHYGGHGAQDGVDGIDGGIPLSDETRFSVVDALGLPQAPRRVVLAACDLGRRGSKAGAPGLGMVQALLLNGAQQVVAAVRPVRDADAALWVRTFYRQLGPDGDLAEAARRTRLALARAHPEVDAAAFQVWTTGGSSPAGLAPAAPR